MVCVNVRLQSQSLSDVMRGSRLVPLLMKEHAEQMMRSAFSGSRDTTTWYNWAAMAS